MILFKVSASLKSASSQLFQGDAEQLQACEKAVRSVSKTINAVSVIFLILTLPVSIDYATNNFVKKKNRRIICTGICNKNVHHPFLWISFKPEQCRQVLHLQSDREEVQGGVH